MSYNTYIGKRGYCIYKNNLSVKEQEYIRKELTVKPFIPNSSPFQNVQSYSIYKESIKKFYLPRYFGINTFGQPNEIKITKGLDINIEFSGTLKERQYFIANKFLNHINNDNYGGLLDLYTGAGKTVLALYLLSKIKKKTLIIVHKGFLLDQWIERINQFLPNAKIGKIQGQIIDIEDKDIVIGMLQSLSMKEYPSKHCKASTGSNPFMNPILGESMEDTYKPICDFETNKNIDNNFVSSLPQSEWDIYNKQNSQRQFYTIPNHTSYADQSEYAKWLYGNNSRMI